MSSMNFTYIGMNLNASPVVYAALDRSLTLLALAAGEMDDAAAFVFGQSSAVVAMTPPTRKRANAALRRRLLKSGFAAYPSAESRRLFLKTDADACYAALAGHTLLAKSALEGRLQRHLLLGECGLQVQDAMDFFEEMTRYKMARGIFPMELLYQPEQLDALAAAYMAWLALNKPEKIARAGQEREEWVIVG